MVFSYAYPLRCPRTVCNWARVVPNRNNKSKDAMNKPVTFTLSREQLLRRPAAITPFHSASKATLSLAKRII
jgi:hypothetical protein